MYGTDTGVQNWQNLIPKSVCLGVEEMTSGTAFFQQIQADISQFYSSPRQPQAGGALAVDPRSLCGTYRFPLEMCTHVTHRKRTVVRFKY